MDKRTYQDLMNIYQEMYQVDEGRAMGSARADDQNPKGANVRVSSGRGMTMTPAAGLGKDKAEKNNPKADDKRAQRQKDQAKADRRAAAMDRRREGTAKPSKLDSLLKDIKNS